MTARRLRTVWIAVVGLVGLLVAGCTPLPEYPYAFTVTLEPSGGAPITFTGADGGEPLISGQSPSTPGDPSKDLYITLGGTVDETSFLLLFSREGGSGVESLTVLFDGDSYTLKDVATDQIPDAFLIEEYVDPTYPGALGKITGGFSTSIVLPADPDDGTTMTVSVSNVDALVRARD